MKYTNMYLAIRKVLGGEQTDFAMTNKTAAQIELWSRMFSGKSPWLNDKIQDAELSPAIAGEIARLITLELQSKVDGSTRAVYIDKFYRGVLKNLRIQVEYGCAKGGLIIKPYVSTSGISVQFLHADCFFPIEFDGDKITKCAFIEQFKNGNSIYTRVEYHSLSDSMLTVKNRAFVAHTEAVLGSDVSLDSIPRWSELSPGVTFSGVSKLPFGYFKVPAANNVDSESPLGVSVYARAVGLIREADRRYSQINWEYDSKETAIHIATSLLKYRQDLDKFEYPGGKERLYREMEYNSGAIDKPFIEAFSPDIRDQSFYNGWNQQMRRIEFNCNLAYGTLSDPNNTDKTAEEIRASKQRSYAFVSDCQTSLQTALEDTVDAMNFWCDIYNLAPPGVCNMTYNWDDSIVVDADKERQTDREDVAMGVMQPWEYRMKHYGEDEETAKKMIAEPAGVIE